MTTDFALNYKVIKEVLTKELEHIQLNEPDRFIKVSNQNEKKLQMNLLEDLWQEMDF